MRLNECIRSGAINGYTKYKMPDVSAISIAVGAGKLVAVCSDNNLRVWDAESASPLKGIAI